MGTKCYGDVDTYIRKYNPETVKQLLELINNEIEGIKQELAENYPMAKMNFLCTEIAVRDFAWRLISLYISRAIIESEKTFTDEYLEQQKKFLSKYHPKFVGMQDNIIAHWTFTSNEDALQALQKHLFFSENLLKRKIKNALDLTAYLKFRVTRLQRDINLINNSDKKRYCDPVKETQEE